MKIKNTKQALVASFLVFIMCLTMFVGSTFAWFTDSVTSARNTIVSGNLDVELKYRTWNTATNAWNEYAPVTTSTKIFNEGALYEPGYTEVVKFKVENVGSLSFKYNFNVNVYDETEGDSVEGGKFKLSDYLYTGIANNIANSTEAVSAAQNKLSTGFVMRSDKPLEKNESEEFVLVLTMPTTVGNAANYKKGGQQPSIDLGVTLVATQYTSEFDDFGNQYDNGAKYPHVSAPAALPTGGATANESIVLGTNSNLEVTVPVEVVNNIVSNSTTTVSSVSLVHTVPEVDTTNNSVKFDSIELVDQNNNVVDLEDLNNTTPVQVVLPVQNSFNNGETVSIYHDGVLVAVATVVNGEIKYECNHFCEVEIVKAPFADGKGTQDDPFIISNLNDMLKIGDMSNVYCYYKVKDGVNEIDALGGKIYVDLCGSFDGNGVTFKNMSDGLFNKVYGVPGGKAQGSVTVENFSVEYTNASPHGAIRYNYAENMTLRNIKVTGTIENTYNTSSFLDYGSCGIDKVVNVSIDNCHSDATVIITGGNASGFVGHYYCSTNSIFVVTNSSFTGHLYSSNGVKGCKEFCGTSMNFDISFNGVTVKGNGVVYDAEKSHAIKVNTGTLPEKYGVFTVAKEVNYDHAEAQFIVGPNGNGTTVIGGYFCANYIVEAPVVDGDNLKTVNVKYYDIYCNKAGVTETGISADGKEFNIVNDLYNQEIGGASVRLVQYDADNNIISITAWKIK